MTIAGDPTSYESSPNYGVLACGINGDLVQFQVINGSWTHYDISAAAGAVTIADDPASYKASGIIA